MEGCLFKKRVWIVTEVKHPVCWWLVTRAGQGSGGPWVLGWQGSAGAAAAMVEAEEM